MNSEVKVTHHHVRTCAGCTHRSGSVGPISNLIARCGHPAYVEPVTGRPLRRCIDMRKHGAVCGPSGELYRAPAVQQTNVRSLSDMLRALIGTDVPEGADHG